MREMRRKERAMEEKDARALLESCAYAVLCMTGPNGDPYAVPISPACDGNDVYFHCAQEGYKLECIAHNENVCLVCAEGVVPLPEQFSTAYRSVVAYGRAKTVTDEAEKIHALRLICKKYAASNMAGFEDAARASLARTGIVKVELCAFTGKQKKLPVKK